jgi:pimeloyl-ACP methyl ester carboxylesterase
MGSAAMADDIDALRQFLGLDTIDLMGHSNGGAIAISYATRYSRHLRKLVLIDSQLIGFGGNEATAAFLAAAADDDRYRDAVAQLTAQPVPHTNEAFAKWLTAILPLYFHNPQRDVPRFMLTMPASIEAAAMHAQRAVDTLPSASQTAALEAIAADVLILSGRHDWICPLVVAERLHAGIRGSTLLVFEHTGHMPWIEEPEHFFSATTRFLGA